MIQRCYDCNEEFEVRRVEWRSGRWDLRVVRVEACPFCGRADISDPPAQNPPRRRRAPVEDEGTLQQGILIGAESA